MLAFLCNKIPQLRMLPDPDQRNIIFVQVHRDFCVSRRISGEFLLSNIYTFSSCLIRNTLRLHTKIKQLMLLRGTIVAYCENDMKHKNSVGRLPRFGILTQVVHIVHPLDFRELKHITKPYFCIFPYSFSILILPNTISFHAT